MNLSIEGKKYIVFFAPRMRVEKIQAFYFRIPDVEIDLQEIQDQELERQQDMISSVTKVTGKLLKYIEIGSPGKASTYRLNDNAIQTRIEHDRFLFPVHEYKDECIE